LELLNLANEFGFIILEDDYDYDFHYDKSPILPLASADTNGMVIYIGSFGNLWLRVSEPALLLLLKILWLK
jgi:GntR family transcriptional regulator/MocR family aminotransferase